MRTTWENWDLGDILDDADAEGRAGLSALAVPETQHLASLPYFSAQVEYCLHVRACAECRASIVGCPAGEVLSRMTRMTMKSQARTAARN